MSNSSLHPKARRLRDAHVEFLLQQCRGQALRRQIRLQVDGVIEDISPLALADIVDADTLAATLSLSIQKLDLGPELAELVGVIARHLYDHPIHQEATLAEVIPEVALEVLFDQLMGLEDLRRALITAVVNNPVFADLVTDLLLQGIRDFAANGAGVGRVPGAQSAMKIGQGLMKKATTAKNGDDIFRRFVSKHMQSSLQASETFLNLAFEGEGIRDGVQASWQHIRDVPLAEFREMVRADQVEDIAMLVTAMWRDFRCSDFLAAMIRAGVDGFYEQHGRSPMSVVLKDLGVTPDLWRTVLSQLLPEILSQLEAAGALRAILERLLDDFYASDTLIEILEEDS